MKLTRIALQFCIVGMLASATVASAQDADKQKLMEIEKALAASATPGPEAAVVMKKYLYEGPLDQLTAMGRIGTLSKARVVELYGKPDPSDPAVKTTQKISDFRIEIYGDTALVGYKLASTDTGHKDAALNVTDHWGCLDTFVKRNAQWYSISNACSPDAPLPQAEWDAVKKARTMEPKDVQQAYH